MRAALDRAGSMLGLTAPNPAVGCLIVSRAGQVVGSAATARGGRPHAETQALAAAGHCARGATAYVSLEPCAHHGQTPPCAQALIEAGVARVVVGCCDPHPLVRGRGLRMLRRAKIETIVGVLEEDCLRLNEGFFTRVTMGRPFTLLKLASTLDGRIATVSGDSRWISCEASRRLVHQWRRECDIVMLGAGSVVADNPRLTCRIEGGRDPVRVVVDAKLRTDPAARVFRQRSKAPTLLATSCANEAAARDRYGRRVDVLGLPEAAEGVDLSALMRRLAERGWSKVLLEGGAHLAASALEAGLVDRVAVFVAPKLLGSGLSAIEGRSAASMRDALKLHDLTARPSGDDWLLEAIPFRRVAVTPE